MAVGADAHQHEIEQRPGRIELIGAIERFQLASRSGGRLRPGSALSVGIGWMLACGRAAIEEKPAAPCAMLLRGSSAGDEALVADEPVHAVPRDSVSIGIGRQQLIELFRARSAGQADRDAAAVGVDPCHQTIRGGFRQRRRIGDDDPWR